MSGLVIRIGALGRAALLGMLLGAAACNGCGGCGAQKAADAGLAEAPVPAPAALLADLYVTSPNASWSKLQRGVGGAAGILPATLPGIIVTMADLDVRIAFELDGAAPMYGVLAGDPASPKVCVAMKLVDPRRARGVLTDGEAALYTPRESGALTHLVPKTHPAEKASSAAALTKNGWVVVGRTPEDLDELAPYTTRTLPTRPLPKEGAIVADVPHASVEKVLAPKLESAWADAKSFLLSADDRARSEHGGRAPDFGDPKAIVAALDAVVGRRIAVFRDLERVRIALDVNDDAIVATATLTPAAGDGPARKWIHAMRVGDAAAVLGQSSASAVALSIRDTDEDRAAQATEMEKAIVTSLGDRLKADDAKKLHDVFDDWTKGRGEVLTVAYTADEPSGTLVTTHARDAEAANRAMRSAVDLARTSPFKELLRASDVTSSAEDVPGFGKAQVVKVARVEPKAKEAKPKEPARPRLPSGLAWSTEAGDVTIAVGKEPLAVLRTGLRPDKKLRDEPLVGRFGAEVGDTASTVVVVQPLKLDPSRANLPAAPVALALTRKGDDAVVRFDVSDGLLREVSRMFAGF